MDFANGADAKRLWLQAQYDPWLVLLSLLVILLSFLAMQGVVDRCRSAEGVRLKLLWWGAGSLTVSLGAWAMHFIGMLALSLPLQVSYDLRLTLLSLLPNFIIFGLCFFSIYRPNPSTARLWAAAIVAAMGVGLMHFTGMLAMHGVERQLIMEFDLALPCIASALGCWLFYRSLQYYAQHVVNSATMPPSSWPGRWTVAMLQAAGVAVMHYSAMAATHYYSAGNIANTVETALSPTTLSLLVAFASFLVTGLVTILAVIDRRLQEAALAARVSRARMVESIESILDGFALFDLDDRLVVCNQRYRELMDAGQGIRTGMAFEEILIGLARKGLVRLGDVSVEDWIAARLVNDRNSNGYFVAQWRDGQWFQVSERHIADIGTVRIATDITGLKRAELEKEQHLRQEQRYREEAIRSETTLERHRSLTQMVAGVAHEVNTPLGVAVTALSVMENSLRELNDGAAREADANVRRLIEDLLESGDLLNKNLRRAHKLVESFKRVSVDQLTETRETVRLDKLIVDTLELFKPQARRAGLDMMLNCAEVEGQEWLGYPAFLTQVLLNLLQNIERYAYPDNRGGRVEITVRDGNKGDKHYLSIEVRDHGAGMDAHILPRIFDPFFTTGRGQGGTGLGLSLVHNLVTDRLGGSIEVQSELGRGTAFFIVLPKKVREIDLSLWRSATA